MPCEKPLKLRHFLFARVILCEIFTYIIAILTSDHIGHFVNGAAALKSALRLRL
jgi:hypothetical protein